MTIKAIELRNVSKSFGPLKAVDNLSFEVRTGEIFGLLGPNGAGKTTTIRLILDIFKPDQGVIQVFGGTLTMAGKDRIGYMPEERGLYIDLPLVRCLVYMATIKGIPAVEARNRARQYLERFELAPYRGKKIKELSKGMQQKAQLIATLLHRPDLLIVDEPFSGLDPVNTRMVKSLLAELREAGVSIVMSTHQMHQAEELCDRILLVRRGRGVLYGDLPSIRRQFAGNAVRILPLGPVPELPGVARTVRQNGHYLLDLAPGAEPADVLHQLVQRGVRLEGFEVAAPTLDDIFVRMVATESGSPVS